MVLASGCDSSSDRPAPEVSEPASLAVGARQEEAAGTTTDSGSWRPLAVPTPSDPDTYPLLILNSHRVPLTVFADGGAGEVLLDTVVAGDSAWVKLLIGADSVTLRAVGLDGTTGPPERIGLEREPGARWEARY
jgi:hypothetical protein